MEEIQQRKEACVNDAWLGWEESGMGWMDDMPLVVRDAAPEKDCEPRLPAQRGSAESPDVRVLQDWSCPTKVLSS